MFHGTHKFLLLLAVLLYISGCSGGEPISPDRHGGDLPGAIGSMHDEIPDQPEFVEGEVLVVLNDGIKAASMNPIADQLGMSLVKKAELMWGTVYRMSIDSGETVESMVATLITYPEVKYAEPNYILYPMGEPYFPNDPDFDCDWDDDDVPWSVVYDQWGPNVVGASLCWPQTKGEGIVIASPDTGIRTTHEDLKNQIWINEDEIPDNHKDDDDNGYIDDWQGWNYDNNNGDIYDWDMDGHGTGVAGVFVAEQDNNKGCTGIAPGSRVMPLVIGGPLDDYIESFQYAYDNGADIVSIAYGISTDSQILHDTVTAVWDDGNGLLMTGAAGNDWGPDVIYPAAWPEIIAVGATQSFGSYAERCDVQRTDFSCYGENLEVMAPGRKYLTTDGFWDDYYKSASGTSISVQVVAGCLALMMSENPDLTNTQLRQRLNETCDDLYEPGYDLDSGWGRVNVYRAIYGSDPNSDVYDANGHIPHPGDNKWFFDNIFDISTSADYDFEDIFVLDCDEAGMFRLTVDIMTTGEDLDMELYDDPELAGAPVAAFYGPNGEDKPTESIEFFVTQGEKYYLRVYSAGPYNCSNYGVRFDCEPYCWWIESESLAPEFVHSGSDELPLLEVEFHTTLSVTPERIAVYVAGTVPLYMVNHFRLYEDTNNSGAWEVSGDEMAGSATPSVNPVGQVVFDNLDTTSTLEEPARYFIIADIGPNDLLVNVTAGVGIHSYKDIDISENLPLKDDPFAVISDLTQIGESQPPEWCNAIGIQQTKSGYTTVTVKWNNAKDIGNEPTSYNVYWDDSFPSEISTGMMVENIETFDGAGFDSAGKVYGLMNGWKYHFCVRAVDAIGNEDDNEVWLSGTPDGVPDPLNPELLTSLHIQGGIENIWVNDGIAYVGDSSRIRMYDCTDPTSPWSAGWYGGFDCRDVQYHESQDYVYCAIGDDHDYAMVTLAHPPEPGQKMIKIADSFPGEWSEDICVDGDICYLLKVTNFQNPYLYVVDIDNPENPVMLGSLYMGSGIGRKITARDGFVFCSTTAGVKVVDATTPAAPEIVYDGYNDDIRDIFLWGDYALAANEDTHSLIIYDINDPAQPLNVGYLPIPSYKMTSLAVRDDHYVYLAARQPASVMVIDWSDLDNIHKVADIACQSPRDIFYDGEFLYIADGSGGLKILF